MTEVIIQNISYPETDKAGIKLSIARIDRVNPLASGNKYYKLSPNFNYAREHGYSRLLSFGGAYSNHIHALALYASEQGFKTIGIIRGESDYANNPTLTDAQKAGMKLEFVTREEYRRRNDEDYLKQLQQRYPDALIIPEGGSSQLAVSGCQALMHSINKIKQCDIVAVASGTGATFAGLVCGLNNEQTAISYAALRDSSLDKRIRKYLEKQRCKNTNYEIISADYGGFAKFNKELLDFILSFYKKTSVLLDPIYTGKMLFRFMEQVKRGNFTRNTSICMIHSGGLQGWRGMKPQVIKLGGKQSWAIINTELQRISYAMDCKND